MNQPEKENIKLKPLTSGLGLDHFTDGLPYSPAANKRKSVQFSFPPPRPPRSTVQDEGLSQSRGAIPTASSSPNLSKATAAAVSAAALALEPELEAQPASLILRALAFWVDISCAVGIFGFIVYAAFFINGIAFETIPKKAMLFPLSLMFFVVTMSYFMLLEFSWKKTFGKALLGMRLEAPSGFELMIRNFLFLFSFLPLGIGFFSAFFDSKKRCWHDKFTHTEVVVSK